MGSFWHEARGEKEMKLQRSHFVVLIVGMLLGMVFMAGSSSETGAAGGALEALPATIDIRVDGQRENIEAYAIKGTTFVRLVDVGKSVDFNVYWDGKAMAVQVESGKPYTGKESVGAKSEKTVEDIRKELDALYNAIGALSVKPQQVEPPRRPIGYKWQDDESE